MIYKYLPIYCIDQTFIITRPHPKDIVLCPLTGCWVTFHGVNHLVDHLKEHHDAINVICRVETIPISVSHHKPLTSNNRYHPYSHVDSLGPTTPGPFTLKPTETIPGVTTLISTPSHLPSTSMPSLHALSLSPLSPISSLSPLSPHFSPLMGLEVQQIPDDYTSKSLYE
jgi:hypothetical protein